MQVTNTSLLEAKIKASGLKKGYLALKCGLTRAGFRNCLTNAAEFKASQMVVLAELLGIKDPEEFQAIFFCRSGA